MRSLPGDGRPGTRPPWFDRSRSHRFACSAVLFILFVLLFVLFFEKKIRGGALRREDARGRLRHHLLFGVVEGRSADAVVVLHAPRATLHAPPALVCGRRGRQRKHRARRALGVLRRRRRCVGRGVELGGDERAHLRARANPRVDQRHRRRRGRRDPSRVRERRTTAVHGRVAREGASENREGFRDGRRRRGEVGVDGDDGLARRVPRRAHKLQVTQVTIVVTRVFARVRVLHARVARRFSLSVEVVTGFEVAPAPALGVIGFGRPRVRRGRRRERGTAASADPNGAKYPTKTDAGNVRREILSDGDAYVVGDESSRGFARAIAAGFGARRAEAFAREIDRSRLRLDERRAVGVVRARAYPVHERHVHVPNPSRRRRRTRMGTSRVRLDPLRVRLGSRLKKTRRRAHESRIVARVRAGDVRAKRRHARVSFSILVGILAEWRDDRRRRRTPFRARGGVLRVVPPPGDDALAAARHDHGSIPGGGGVLFFTLFAATTFRGGVSVFAATLQRRVRGGREERRSTRAHATEPYRHRRGNGSKTVRDG